MTRYRIHIDPKLPDPKQIRARQDFDSLYDHYQVHTRFAFWRQLYRNPKNFGMVAIIAAIAFLVFQASEETPAQADTANLQAPVAAWQLQPTTFTIDPKRDTVLILEEDMRLHIPQSAFWQADSQMVNRPYSLQAHVLQTPLQWLRAGLPMSDSVRVKTGPLVVGVWASLDDQPLSLAPPKQLVFHTIIPDTHLYASIFRIHPDGSLVQGMPLLAHAYADTQAILALGPKPSVPPAPLPHDPHMARLNSAEIAAATEAYTSKLQHLQEWEAAYDSATQPVGYHYVLNLPSMGYVGWVREVARPRGEYPAQLFMQGQDTLGYTVKGDQLCLSCYASGVRQDTCFRVKDAFSLEALEDWCK